MVPGEALRGYGPLGFRGTKTVDSRLFSREGVPCFPRAHCEAGHGNGFKLASCVRGPSGAEFRESYRMPSWGCRRRTDGGRRDADNGLASCVMQMVGQDAWRSPARSQSA